MFENIYLGQKAALLQTVNNPLRTDNPFASRHALEILERPLALQCPFINCKKKSAYQRRGRTVMFRGERRADSCCLSWQRGQTMNRTLITRRNRNLFLDGARRTRDACGVMYVWLSSWGTPPPGPDQGMALALSQWIVEAAFFVFAVSLT